MDLLIRTGFDADRARYLAERHPPDVIRQQVEWLALRTASTSRLGLLRRAIEQNWPKPEPSPAAVSPELQAGVTFAQHYYAGYHGNHGEPAAEPFPNDAAQAVKLLEHIRSLTPEADVAGWGRRFGRFVRDQHQGNAGARPYLRTALTLYGVVRNAGSMRLRSSSRGTRRGQC